MNILKAIAFTAILVTVMALAPQELGASSSTGVFVGISSQHHGYYPSHRPYYHRSYYYRPYFYGPYFGGFYNPYYYGYGYGGYGLGYGYGYPGSYYYGYFGEIRTEVKPNEANVFVDGDFAGEADDFDGWWQRLEVEPGRHRLTFRAPGFAPYVVDVSVAPGRDVHIKYQMVPGQDQIAELEMRLPPEESEGRDRYKPRDPYRRSDPRKYDDRDRQYDRDEPNDRDEQYERYRTDRDRYNEGQRQNESNRQSLVLLVEPSDATVYIDGNYYGTANDNGGGEIQVLLPEGVHRVEVVRPGYASASQDVNISRTGENRLTIKLLKK